MSRDTDILKLLEILLTVDIFNNNPNLDINDLTPQCRDLFGLNAGSGIHRPVNVSEGMVRRAFGITEACSKVASNPVISCEEFGQRMHITALDPAARWFLKHGGKTLIERNPTLAYFFETFDTTGVSYQTVKAANPRYEDTKSYMDGKISKILSDDDRLRPALDLIIIYAPEEIEQHIEDIVCTDEQNEIIAKINIARKNREILQKYRIYEVGKLLFVGPPGTGKTTLALALSSEMHLPILEVRLSMVTSQYLGETSKNIDRIFDLAKKLAPCILFIDEFDFVAKSRVTDDHGAMKRAVNSLLKNIDKISLIRDSVLIIGATNHPQLLDEAAWRRFDEVIEFSLPDEQMREDIIRKITATLSCECDYHDLAQRTDGFSGSDLRIMIKEAILTAMMQDRDTIGQEDIEKGIQIVINRDKIRALNWQ